MKGRARGRQRQRGYGIAYRIGEDGLVLAVASQTKLGTTTPVLFRHASLEYKVDGDWTHQRDLWYHAGIPFMLF